MSYIRKNDPKGSDTLFIYNCKRCGRAWWNGSRHVNYCPDCGKGDQIPVFVTPVNRNVKIVLINSGIPTWGLMPEQQVKEALKFIESDYILDCNNNPDFISTVEFVCEAKGIERIFIMNGEEVDHEAAFKEFNKALTLIDETVDNINRNNAAIEKQARGSICSVKD